MEKCKNCEEERGQVYYMPFCGTCWELIHKTNWEELERRFAKSVSLEKQGRT